MNFPSRLGLFCWFFSCFLSSFRSTAALFLPSTPDFSLHLSNLTIPCRVLVVQAAMCQPEQFKGHQLGQFSVAAPDPGPLLPFLAGEDSLGAGAAQGPADHSPADQQTGRALEGTA